MKHIPIPVLLLVASMTAAQDMPLHEILKVGETWQPHTGEIPKPPRDAYALDPLKSPLNKLKKPTCCAVSLGGSTLFVADADDRYVWAFRIEAGTLGPGDRYCRLRVAGDDRRKNSPAADFRADPSAMVVDAASRTYVATNLGIQVFDPTGRLCGVFTAPPGRVTEMAFNGDRLLARADGKVFVRRMLAKGAN